MEDKIIKAMQQLGFTATDAKTYVGLLKRHPATGYELASRSGVPRSAIYNVLGRLESQGLINVVQEKPAKYTPLPPERLYALLESRFSGSIDELRSSLESLNCETREASTWTIHGYRAVIDQAKSLIEASTKSVFASLWGSEAKLLAPALRQVAGAGKDVVLFSFTPLPRVPGDLYSYNIAEQELAPYWSHKIILVADHQRVLVGGAEDHEDNRAVVTEESALVEMAMSNLILDITLFGQRTGVSTSDVITKLTQHLAPVEELVANALREAGNGA